MNEPTQVKWILERLKESFERLCRLDAVYQDYSNKSYMHKEIDLRKVYEDARDQTDIRIKDVSAHITNDLLDILQYYPETDLNVIKDWFKEWVKNGKHSN